ncbi:site-specific integrase [Streptomyces violaceusniger]
MFRTLYHPGLRSEEASLLDKPDVHFSRGPSGKLHVRFGKAAHTSGPRPRWVPLLDGLDLMLRWFLEDVRSKFPDSPVLFADESGGSLHRGTIRNRLRYLMELEGRPPSERFSPHAPAQSLRDPQLRTRRRPRGDPADARSAQKLEAMRDLTAKRHHRPPRHAGLLRISSVCPGLLRGCGVRVPAAVSSPASLLRGARGPATGLRSSPTRCSHRSRSPTGVDTSPFRGRCARWSAPVPPVARSMPSA